tara:strand:+ start:1501 stop:2796 length:1296 start_codon:yes stop_codon:yes gene_type:complete
MPELAQANPSHTVTEDGSKVTIHDLELFVGHIPGFDDSDSGMEDLDEEAIEKIITRTKAHMSAGSNPKLVMLHQDESNDAPPEALGDIINIRRQDIQIDTDDGESFSGPGIVGDIIMSRKDFESYVSSNKYPRRSAEIWKDGHMSEVALLGRETPARPLRDTRFGKTGDKSIYTRPMTFAEVAPGGSNTFVPTFGDKEKKDNEMPNDEDDRMVIDHNGDDKDITSKLRAENESLREELEQLKMQMNSDSNDEEVSEEDRLLLEMDDDKDKVIEVYEEEEEEEEDKVMMSKLRSSKAGKVLYKKLKNERFQKNAYKKLASRFGMKLRKAKFSKVLDDLQAEGYRIRNHRDHMMDELCSTQNTDAKVKFWRQTLTRDPIGRSLNMAHSRVSGKSEYSAEERKAASERAVARMTKEGLADDQFRSVFDTELKTG